MKIEREGGREKTQWPSEERDGRDRRVEANLLAVFFFLLSFFLLLLFCFKVPARMEERSS